MSYLCAPIPFYVYKIICKPTGQYYFGSRYSHVNKGIDPHDDLWKRYYTSSQIIKSLLTLYSKDQFDAIIVRLFEDKNDAFWYEQALIGEHIDDPLCVNLNFMSYTDGKRIAVPAGLKVWTHSTTHQRRWSTMSPGDDWFLGGSHNENCMAYHKNGQIKYFESDPGEGWAKGFGNLRGDSSIPYGNNYNQNKLWWNDGVRSVMRQVCPGPAWTLGRLTWTTVQKPTQDKRSRIGTANKGKKAYNDGYRTIMRKEHPGPGWTEGILSNITTKMKQRLAKKDKPGNTAGKHWWNNGAVNKLTEICPGNEWSEGRLRYKLPL